jgi:proline iminopeptidase
VRLLFLAILAAAAAALVPRETRVPVGRASLYVRVVGQGPPVLVLHGGPDFDHSYLLPELDRLGDAFRVVYYDQRGRGRSAEHVRPEDVSLGTDVEDVDAVRRHLGLEAPILLGHSWGTVLALEYALRHPTHVSRLILMNPAPASTSDRNATRQAYLEALGPAMDRQRQILESEAYRAGNPEAVTARYRIHFQAALQRPEDHARLMTRMEAAFRRQGKQGILKARAVEDRLMGDTWEQPGYDLLPKLRDLPVPTLVLAADHDFIPVQVARHIAEAIPNGKLVTLNQCGHFAYLECPDEVRKAMDGFFGKRGAE